MNDVKLQRKCKTNDQLEVFCRLKPPKCDPEIECIDVMSSTMLRITAPESNRHSRDGAYIFQEIFTANTPQKKVFESVGMPLVRNLIRGQNGLLFSYGVTGSGKTYTMNGDKFNSGIVPRAINAIFNSIAEFQAPQCVFKSDQQNGYFIQGENAVLMDILKEHRSKNPKKTSSENDIPCLLNDHTRVDSINEDNLYTVFVSYIEIYNNLITDLLDSTGKQLKLREGTSNVYVEDAKEIEVRSNEEAVDLFNAGQKRKRMGVTNANKESSRSHSIFTIKLVQAPVNESGDRIVDDSTQIQVSQLCLVDLAGSERNSRAQTAGQSLVEACSINNSLMFLRNCMQELRENQLKGLAKRVQYRNCKLTHLFKNYFDGIGAIKMVICITPEVDDLTETFHVLEFAEMAQEIQTSKQNPTNTLKNQKFTPGRRKANQMLKDFMGSVETVESQPSIKFDFDAFQHEFPEFEYHTQTEAKQVLNNIINHLEVRIDRQKEFESSFKTKIGQFHDAICTTEKDNILKQFEISNLESINETLNTKIKKSEETIFQCEQKIKELTNKLVEKEKKMEQLSETNKSQERQISQLQAERRKNKLKLTEHAAKLNNEAESKFEAEKKKLKAQYEQRTQKLNIMRKILDQPTPTSSVLNLNLNDDQDDRIRKRVDKAELPAPGSVKKLIAQQQQKMSLAAQQYRRRRSKSCGDRWIEHKPIQGAVTQHTLLQPMAKITKSVTKLGNMKDVVNAKTSKYFLRSEEKEENGEISTKFYKGDVIPTIGGGAQVIFDDIEVLKQESPLTLTPSKSSNKRRHDDDDNCGGGGGDGIDEDDHHFVTPSTATGSSNSVDVQDRCRSALMGFSKKSKLF